MEVMNQLIFIIKFQGIDLCIVIKGQVRQAAHRNNKIPLNISLKKNLEMNSRSRESSLKREKQKEEEQRLASEASETIQSGIDLQNQAAKPKKKKIKRNNWRNIFYKQIKNLQEEGANANPNYKSEWSESISFSNKEKGKNFLDN